MKTPEFNNKVLQEVANAVAPILERHRKANECPYCGENKWQNKEKHLAEARAFLKEKQREIADLLIDTQLRTP